MTEEDRKRIISNNYPDFFIEPDIDSNRLANLRDSTINYIDDRNAVIHIDVTKASQDLTGGGFSSVPKLFGLVDSSNLEEMGVKKVQNTPALSLRGQGVLLGFIDTGIDYTNPLFKYADNTTRIVSIWDQTIENMQATEDTFYYGTEYTRYNINLALQNENSLSVGPSSDTIGHGTTLAGLAGGSIMEYEDYSGVAPFAEYAIVKLKPAKTSMKFFYSIPEEAICYQENDIMFGIQYLYKIARLLNRPIAICIALGTNQGAHDGRSPLSLMLSDLASRKGIAIIVAAGNEGNTGHHYYGIVDKTIGYDTVELKVGEQEHGFMMEIWGHVPSIYSIAITSPTGEYINRIPARLDQGEAFYFLFEKTKIIVQYYMIEPHTGDQLIMIDFNTPMAGIWRFHVYCEGDTTSGFHIWLPSRGFIKEDTIFVRSNPDTTITSPGNAHVPITVTAYDHLNKSIYLKASRGYTRDNTIKPDFAAPGVEIFGPKLGNSYGLSSGTSIAAAEVTGVAAMLLEWGIVKGNNSLMNSLEVKKLLLRGVKGNANLLYPNKEWGYGILDIFSTFASLRKS